MSKPPFTFIYVEGSKFLVVFMFFVLDSEELLELPPFLPEVELPSAPSEPELDEPPFFFDDLSVLEVELLDSLFLLPLLEELPSLSFSEPDLPLALVEVSDSLDSLELFLL
jgi:hypothetical protein